MSAIDMRTENVARQEGHRLFLGHFSPDYASDPMDETKFDQLLAAVCLEVKSDVINHLQRQREGCLLHGYDGPFCGIRVDMTHVGQVAYGTASCSIIPTNFSEVVHLVLGTRSFQGHHLDKQLQLWLKKVTNCSFGGAVGTGDGVSMSCLRLLRLKALKSGYPLPPCCTIMFRRDAKPFSACI